MEFVPSVTGPEPRDFVEFLDSDRGEEFFRGAWGWFAVIVVLAVFNTVFGEELIPIEAYSSRRFESALMGIVVHSTQSVVLIIVVLTVVLA